MLSLFLLTYLALGGVYRFGLHVNPRLLEVAFRRVHPALGFQLEVFNVERPLPLQGIGIYLADSESEPGAAVVC